MNLGDDAHPDPDLPGNVSDMPGIPRDLSHDQGDLGDLSTLAPTRIDPERPGFGRLSLQGHDQVMPGRIGGCRHVRRARIGLGVGVRVHHPPNLESEVVALAFGSQVILGVDRVDPGRLLDIAAREEVGDVITGMAGLSRASHQPTRFERVFDERQRAQRVIDLGSDRESPCRLVVSSLLVHQDEATTSVAWSVS